MSVEAVLLGTAQDGGVPQAGCHCALCTRARTHPTRRQWVACLGLVDRAACQSWLIDATPDLPEPLSALHILAPDCPLAGIALTHAHVGHYAGLIHLNPATRCMDLVQSGIGWRPRVLVSGSWALDGAWIDDGQRRIAHAAEGQHITRYRLTRPWCVVAQVCGALRYWYSSRFTAAWLFWGRLFRCGCC